MSERREYLERTFSEDACERLTVSDQGYYRTHGHYVPPLAELLNITRAELASARAQLEQLREALRDVEPWLMVPSDTYEQHHAELGRVREAVRDALAAVPAARTPNEGGTV